MRPSVYEAATESAAASSIGYWRIRADYAEGDTFDQELKIERVFNPFAVFLDRSRRPTQDARYGFIVAEMPKKTSRRSIPTPGDGHHGGSPHPELRTMGHG